MLAGAHWLLGLLRLACVLLQGIAPDPASRLGFYGLHGGAFDELAAAAPALGLALEDVSDWEGRATPVDWAAFDVLVLQHIAEDEGLRLQPLLVDALGRKPALRIVSLEGLAEAALPELAARGALTTDPRMEAYYRASGPENLRRLLAYVAVEHLGRPGEVLPPMEPPPGVLFHPGHDGPFASVDELLAWSALRAGAPAGPARAAVIAHHIHRVLQQPRVVAALVDALERRGLVAAVIEDGSPEYRAAVLAFAPDVVVHTCHGMEDVDLRIELDAPQMQSVFLRVDSIEQWRANPTGLDANTLAFQLASQELLGQIEPLVAAGTEHGGQSSEDFSPIPDRVEHLADRAAAWARLRRTPNVEKRVALITYNREMGKGDLMRGSATGMFLNAPRSMLKVLERLAAEGYRVEDAPRDEEELLARLADHGRQVGAWDPAELDRIARSGKAILVAEDEYRAWFEAKVPAQRRAQVIAKFGPPPGGLQLWEREDGARFLVLPCVRLGQGAVLLPQPLRGEAHDVSLAHDTLIPPSHNYLATYFWLQEGFKADALVHFGTHGTEILLPGKGAGLASDDWTELVIGNLPNITVWVINNLGESLAARRRASAVLIDHLVPPSVSAGLDGALLSLHDDLDKYEALEEGALKKRFGARISAATAATGLAADLHFEGLEARTLTAEELQAVAEHLHKIHNETIPVGLHVLGEPPDQKLLAPYLVTCLGGRFLDALEAALDAPQAGAELRGDRQVILRARAEELVELAEVRGLAPLDAFAALTGGPAAPPPEILEGLALAHSIAVGLARTGDELDHLFSALSGRFVPPGPGNSPDRNPGSVPTGRNMVLLNPEQVPSQPSFELGSELAEELLRQRVEQLGRPPTKVGFTLNSFATFQDFGVMESEILTLLGVRPRWDARGLVNDVDLIPREELGRPRVDVFLAASAYYRDMLPSRMRLLDRAIRLAAASPEADNPVRAADERVAAELRAAGVPDAAAQLQARARIFSQAPGEMSTSGYYYLVERSGEWDGTADLVSAYLAHVRWAYTDGAWGEELPAAYERQIQGTEVVLRSWSDRTLSPLSNKYDWYQGGSLCLAIETLTGKKPDYILTDARDPDRARLVGAEDALRVDFRARLFNKKWIEGLMTEGYAGADQIAVHASNALGWEVTRSGSVGPDLWMELVDTYVRDEQGLGLREWFEDVNPYAFQDVTTVFLEAIRKGYWDAPPETRRELARALADSVSRHGTGGGMREGGNEQLERFVAELLSPSAPTAEASGELPADAPADALAGAAGPSSAPAGPPEPAPEPQGAESQRASEEVQGRALEPVASDEPQGWGTSLVWAAAGGAALVLAGFATRFGALARRPRWSA